MHYELWYAPTLLGQTSFKWTHELKLVYDEEDYDDAEFNCYIHNVEERSPDAALFGSYILIGPL